MNKNNKKAALTRKSRSVAFLSKDKKAIGPVVAVALLIVVSVVAVMGFQNWFGTYSSGIFIKTEKESQATSQTNIETLVGDQLYFKNTFDDNLTIKQIKIGNKECNISTIIESGVHNISLRTCLDNLTLDSSIEDIVVITDKTIYTKKHLFKEFTLSNSSVVSNPIIEVLYGNDANTVLLIHSDGTLLNTQFNDSSNSTHLITANGNVKHVNFKVNKIGTGAVYFDGTGDYLSVPDSSDWYFGTGAFTVEFWVKFDTKNVHHGIFSQNIGLNDESGLEITNLNKFHFYSYVGPNRGSTNIFDYNVNQWYHIALVRDSSGFRIYVDGELFESFTDGTWNDDAAPLLIGAAGGTYGDARYKLNGYLDEFRVSKGIARYTSNFIPQTTEFEPDSYTKLLLHFNNIYTNSFTDSETTPKTVTKYGDTIQKGIPFNSDLAGYFDGTGDYLDISDSTDFDFGTGDFTVDFWTKLKSFQTYNFFLGKADTCDNSGSWAIQYYSGELYFWDFGELSMHYTTSLNLNQWYHIAVVRYGTGANNVKMYIDGNMVQQATFTGDISTTKSFRVGQSNNDCGADFNGYLDEVRISKGIARWTTNFNPPTEPYTQDSYTKLLLHFDGDNSWTNFTDSSSSNHQITKNGEVSTIRTYPFNNSAIYFDGTGDYLRIPASTDFDFGTENFTIDMWVNFDNDAPHYLFYWDNNNCFSWDGNFDYFHLNFNGQPIFTGTFTPVYGSWHHLAITRSGTTVKLYVDGNLFHTATITGNLGTSTSPLLIGTFGITAYEHKGYIDELRISKGIVRWSDTFIPPKEPYKQE